MTKKPKITNSKYAGMTELLVVMIIAVIISTVFFNGGTNVNSNTNTNDANVNSSNIEYVTSNDNQNVSSSDSNNTSTQETTTAESVSADYTAHDWNSSDAPNAYTVRGEAILSYDVNVGEFHYEGLDSNGRTLYAVAKLTKEVYQKELNEDREDFGSDADKISGWGHNVKTTITWPNGKTYNGYAFNRSHLIADSLGGDGARYNLVTGTRYQNVGYDNNGGMAYAEEKAREWLSTAGDDEYLYYSATPIYVNDEIVPRSVYVDILSSDGELNEHIEVYNVTGDTNITLDYSSGYLINSDGTKIE